MYIPMKFRILIDKNRCKGCELCVTVCPRAVISMTKKLNARGDHYAQCIRPDECIGCLNCAQICPDAAVEIAKGED